MNYVQMGYTQRVNTAGYYWDEQKKDGKLQLVLREGKKPKAFSFEDIMYLAEAFPVEDECLYLNGADRWTYSEYQPMNEPNLFRRFAKLRWEREDILRFVERYGLLGIPTTVDYYLQDIEDWFEISCELASDWGRQIWLMNMCVLVWDELSGTRAANSSILQEGIIWKDDVCVIKEPLLKLIRPHLPTKKEELALACVTNDAGRAESVAKNDKTAPALDVLRMVVNRELTNRVSANVEWGKPEYKSLSILYKPNCLIGALWLQFAQVVTDSDRKRTCVCCGKVFSYTRKTKIFCSEACQKRFSRQH